ncbi:MAG: hypothetical protein JRG89_20990, partial [Deltaproteobacteria bacterium]|nr:hypothetical protein [Deltaproteobacteria bacterium]
MKVLCAAGYFLSGGLLLTILLSLPGVASAGGVGGYLEFWRGDQTIEFDVVDQDFTNNRFGLGVVLYTNVARNELLNVRATAGYLRTENTVDDEAHGGAFD